MHRETDQITQRCVGCDVLTSKRRVMRRRLQEMPGEHSA